MVRPDCLPTERTIAHVFIMFAIMVATSSAYCQSQDSLLTLYNQAPDSASRRALSIQIARFYQSSKAYAKAIDYFEKSRHSSLESADLPSLRGLADCYQQLGNRSQEITTYSDVLKLVERDRDTLQIIETMQTLSRLYERSSRYQEAIDINKRMLPIAEASDNFVWVSISLNNLGYLYSRINNEELSVNYFNQGYDLAKRNSKLPSDVRASILTNLGISNARLQKYKEAQQYLAEAFDIRASGNDPVKKAEGMNYLASFDFIHGKVDNAIDKSKQSISWLERAPDSEEKDNTLLASYKLITQIMLKANNTGEYKKYTELANSLQQKIIEQERLKIKQLLEQQMEMEKKEAEFRLLLAENVSKTSRLRQSELEQEKKERELELQLKQLSILKKDNELQLSRYYNQRLENDKISQQLQLVQREATVSEQKQSIELLEKEKELQQLTLDKSRREIDALEFEKEQNARIRLYGIVIISLLIVMLIVGVIGYRFRMRRNEIMAEQFETIRKLNSDMVHRNEELTTINDKLGEKTHELHAINEQLNHTQEIVADQNKQLQVYAKDLEGEVDQRTKEVIEKNLELLHYTGQLEEFTYAISHNIRAPIARLLGLVGVMKVSGEADRKMIMDMIHLSSLDLDRVVNDLHDILSIKSAKHEFESVDVEAVVDSVLEQMNGRIQNCVNVQKQIRVKKVRGVTTYFRDVVHNLVDNAIKFKASSRPCTITISTTLNSLGTELVVEDNGIGIDLHQYGDKLFGLYKRMNINLEGKGLGLYRVKTQVEAMNGNIAVESEVDHGTKFKIQFPSS
jgi:signal transduction histidine kinase